MSTLDQLVQDRDYDVSFLISGSFKTGIRVAMEVEERLNQVAVSQLSKNKKLQQVLEHRDLFQ